MSPKRTLIRLRLIINYYLLLANNNYYYQLLLLIVIISVPGIRLAFKQTTFTCFQRDM